MVRPKRRRWIEGNPKTEYFKPVGIPLKTLKVVEITLDELEAMRLTSVEGMGQIEAAEKMKVSQTTIHRLILSFEKKITSALLNGSAIMINSEEDWMEKYNSE